MEGRDQMYDLLKPIIDFVEQYLLVGLRRIYLAGIVAIILIYLALRV
jgi:hypothetical protein